MSDLFLLDSDIFISSFRTHHPFSYKEFHSFWRWLEKLASEGKVLLLDSVYKEITHKNSKGQIDELGSGLKLFLVNAKLVIRPMRLVRLMPRCKIIWLHVAVIVLPRMRSGSLKIKPILGSLLLPKSFMPPS